MATALDLLMQGVDPKELQQEFWQIEQWRELRLPLSGCLFLDDGTWSPHNCDGESPPHNLRIADRRTPLTHDGNQQPLLCDHCEEAVTYEKAYLQVRRAEARQFANGERGERARWRVACVRCPDPEPLDLYAFHASDIFTDKYMRGHVEQKTWFRDTVGFANAVARCAAHKPPA